MPYWDIGRDHVAGHRVGTVAGVEIPAPRHNEIIGIVLMEHRMKMPAALLSR